MKRSKKYRKQVKAIQIRTRKLIKKYPWLYPRYDWSGKKVKPFDYSFTELDCLPDGWIKTFVDMMCEEIHQDLLKNHYVNKFRILEVKEKYGGMRIYTGPLPQDSKVWDIIEKYSVLSENICFQCGRPDVPRTKDGWILPWCSRCWRVHENNYKQYWKKYNIQYTPKKYEDCMYMSDSRMADGMHWRRFGVDGNDGYTVDISETANKIRARWHIGT